MRRQRGGRSLPAVVLFAAVIVAAGDAHSDYLEVRASAKLKKEATSTSAELAKLDQGALLDLLSETQKNGYYRVASVDGTKGYVYRTLVRRHRGKIPGGSPVVRDGAGAAPITATYVSDATSIPRGPPAKGTFRVHLIDVGSGLAVLVQGNDFTMLFDGGSGDDQRGFSGTRNNSRLLSYLFAALGPSGDARCAPNGDAWPATKSAEVTIDHLFLSHPHDDHGAMLDEVLACYHVKNIWEPGAVYRVKVYQDFVAAAAAEAGATYHTVADVPQNRIVDVFNATVTFPATVTWETFAEGEHAVLGDKAAFDVLFADAGHYEDPNQNSLVLRVQLGSRSLLLTGDAESGARQLPAKEPGETEEALLLRHKAALDVDILQVAHHGSLSSSRRAFLDAVSPQWALIGAGPKNYRGVVLPDPEIVSALFEVLPSRDRLLRTDVHDAEPCPRAGRVGVDDDHPCPSGRPA